MSGQLVRCIEHGVEGAPVALMLHGLPGSAEDWDKLAPALASSFHVVAIDRPGYGGSGADPLPVPEQANLYGDLLASLTTTPALLVGHSYGALSAATLAADRPDLIGALALLAPALREERADREPPPGADAIERVLGKPAVASFLRATVLSEAFRGVIARAASQRSFDPDPATDVHTAGVRDRNLQWETLRSFVTEAKSMRREGEAVDARLTTLTMPAAVVHARGDRVVHPEAGQRTARSIPRCEWHEIDGGHMLTVSRVDEVAPVLQALAARAGLLPATA